MKNLYTYIIKIVAVFIAQFIYIGLLAHQVAKIQTLKELERIERRQNEKKLQQSVKDKENN
jgi:cell division protein FtsL